MKEEPIAIFIGSASAPNVERCISNVGKMLANYYELHLVTTSPEELSKNSLCYYDVFGDRCNSTVPGGFSALYSYMTNNDPKVVFQITQPPIHGFIVGSLSTMFRTSSIYRYSGDRFYAYKGISGKGKIGALIINNLLGLVSMHLADRRISLGPTGKKRMTDRGVNENSVVIIPPAIDISRFEQQDSARPEFSFPTSKKIVMFVGRLSRNKGVATLEASIPNIISQRDDIQFVFVGENRDFDFPTGYKNHVTLTGYIPPKNIPRYLKAADVLVHTGLSEGIPRVILESLTANTPVIARDVGDIGSVTENTFKKDCEFVEMVCDFESLPLDDASQFSLETVGDKYRCLIEQI